jgi:flagellar FliJ protein
MRPRRRFIFPLDTVLKVRRLREDQARQDLARAQAQLARSRGALEETRGHFALTLEKLRHTPQEGWDAQDYQLLCRFLEHLKLAVEGWRDQVSQDEAMVTEKTLILQRFHRERRLLERLKERKFLQYRREVAKFLADESEALVLARWNHS